MTFVEFLDKHAGGLAFFVIVLLWWVLPDLIDAFRRK